MKHHEPNELNAKDKDIYTTLAFYLKSQGGSARLSGQEFANLVNNNFINQQEWISRSTAERKLEKFKNLHLIDICSSGAGCVASLITLVAPYRYEGNLPTGVIPTGSPVYVNREEEEKCKNALKISNLNLKRDELPFIRVKAPRGWGKSTLLRSLEQYACETLSQIVCFIDLNSDIFNGTFNNTKLFLKRFTEEVTESFKQSTSVIHEVATRSKLDSYWNEDTASGKKCTNFLIENVFRKALENGRHITLFIDGVDKVFGYETEEPFLGMLRTWYEKLMKPSVTRPVVGPSLVMAYSTDPYKDFKGSPFNVGNPITLKPFSTQKIIDLSKSYELTLDLSEAEYLEHLLGGHPTLVQHALYYMNQENITLEQLSQKSTQLSGPFGNLLNEYRKLLEKDKRLSLCLKQIMNNETCYDEFGKFLLERGGLIYRDGTSGEAKISSLLYQKYFETIIWQLL